MLRWESPRSSSVRVGLVGFGDVAQQIALGCQALPPSRVEVVGILTRTPAPPVRGALDRSIPRCTDLSELLALSPSVVVEAASAQALSTLGPAILEAGVDLMALSPSCLCDRGTEERFRNAVEVSGRSLVFPSGAGLGLDVLAAAAGVNELEQVAVDVVWEPGNPLPYRGHGSVATVFTGSAREAGLQHQRHLNFLVPLALAGVGLDATQVTLSIDPQGRHMSYVLRIRAESVTLQASVTLPRRGGIRGRIAAMSALQAIQEWRQ
jgi:aspartate dehydrogenase